MVEEAAPQPSFVHGRCSVTTAGATACSVAVNWSPACPASARSTTTTSGRSRAVCSITSIHRVTSERTAMPASATVRRITSASIVLGSHRRSADGSPSAPGERVTLMASVAVALSLAAPPEAHLKVAGPTRGGTAIFSFPSGWTGNMRVDGPRGRSRRGGTGEDVYGTGRCSSPPGGGRDRVGGADPDGVCVTTPGARSSFHPSDGNS